MLNLEHLSSLSGWFYRILRSDKYVSSCVSMVLAVLYFPYGTCGLCRAETHDVLCSDGSGSFQAKFLDEVTVQVGPEKKEGLATRACKATLGSGKQNVVIATGASQVDVDAFGVDLGLGVPVAAFPVKQSAADCCVEYLIYSLEKSPRLLRTITGGGFFSAADTDLDGRIEIWTEDAGAVRSFENLVSDFDSAPTIVLRFEHGDLLDVSSEFQPYFDSKIAGLLNELESGDLHDFKSSDGKLSPDASVSIERLHRLRGVKAKILEIVWCYLYSGREQQAWRSLVEMWPPSDIERIRAAILTARSRGIAAQVSGSSKNPHKREKRAKVFDAISSSAQTKLEVTPPEPIMLRRPPLLGVPDQDLPHSEVLLELVVDSAGKVRSAEPTGKAKPVDTLMIHAASEWKFIPAFKDGRPVASRVRLAVSLKQ